MESRQLVANNLMLTYYSHGQGSEAVIFLHGWRSEGRVWSSAMASVAPLGYLALSLDLPGFGHSQVPPDNFTVGDYAALVENFIKSLNLKTVTLVGHSFGGRIAIKLAAQRPFWLKKIILVDSAGFVMPSFSKKITTFFAKILKPLFKVPGFRRLRPVIYEIIGAEDYVLTPKMESVFRNVINEDLTALLPSIFTPALIIWGDSDHTTPLSWARALEHSIPNARLVVLPNSGHFSFLDQPRAFSRELANFLKVKRHA